MNETKSLTFINLTTTLIFDSDRIYLSFLLYTNQILDHKLDIMIFSSLTPIQAISDDIQLSDVS